MTYSYTQYNYQNRYGNTIARINTEIDDAFQEALATKEKSPVSILDYGCASGRYLPLLEHLAKSAGDTSVEYVGYEPFVKQLHDFENGLKIAEFEKQNDGDLPPIIDENGKEDDGKTGKFDSVVYKKGNLSIKLVHGNIEAEINNISERLPEKTDISLCLFGTLSHELRPEKRIDIMSMLKEKTERDLIVSVPKVESNLADNEKYQGMREQGEDVGDAIREGDIRYAREDGEGNKFLVDYHLFNRKRMEGLLKASGLEDAKVEASNIDHEVNLANPQEAGGKTESPLERLIRDNNDASNSMLLTSDEEIDNKALYYLIKWSNPEKSMPISFAEMFGSNAYTKDTAPAI